MPRSIVLWAALALLLFPSAVAARVTELLITGGESPTFEGHSFGAVGQYERLVGHARGELDPSNPLNAGIVNLTRAPVNARGRVEYEVDVFILKPVDLTRGNGRLFYDVLNRGNKLAIDFVNGGGGDNDPRLASDVGTGFLMNEGYTIVWSAWQGDVPAGGGRMLARFPIATENGAPIVGLSREEFIDSSNSRRFVGDLAYPAATLDPARATLTVRERERDPRQTPPGLAWRYLNERQIEVMRPDSPEFDGGALFEFIYLARDPIVMGIGFAAVRDVVSHLRYEVADDTGRPSPLAPGGRADIDRAVAIGISQSGRFLRDFVWHGSNEDENGRMVFDGVNAHIAGSRKTFTNFVFAQPGRFSRQHTNHLYPGDQFPFTYATRLDSISGKTDGILARCTASNTCPKVMHTDSSNEYWNARGSLVTTDDAGRDIPLPEEVRVYLFASTQHGIADVPRRDTCQQLSNPLNYRPHLRALTTALDQWVTDGTPPPASRYPTVAAGTLVAPNQASTGFPNIPGVTYNGLVNELAELDTSVQPPRPIPGHDYVVLVPKVDADGNDIAGVRHPNLAVPLATYTGWNLHRAGFAEGELCAGTGSYIPFAGSVAERLASGDLRPSLEERYRNQGAYVGRAARAAKRLVRERLLLPGDAERLVEEAAESTVGKPGR
jgi:hypothetical protein